MIPGRWIAGAYAALIFLFLFLADMNRKTKDSQSLCHSRHLIFFWYCGGTEIIYCITTLMVFFLNLYWFYHDVLLNLLFFRLAIPVS